MCCKHYSNSIICYMYFNLLRIVVFYQGVYFLIILSFPLFSLPPIIMFQLSIFFLGSILIRNTTKIRKTNHGPNTKMGRCCTWKGLVVGSSDLFVCYRTSWKCYVYNYHHLQPVRDIFYNKIAQPLFQNWIIFLFVSHLLLTCFW